MPVEEKPVVFTTSDGTEFHSKVDAEKYDALENARSDYEEAKARYWQEMLSCQKTCLLYTSDAADE